jgi:Predicted membrane protein
MMIASLTTVFGHSSDHLLWWQMCLRGLVILLFTVFLLRIAPRRMRGRNGLLDVALAVLVGSSLARALTGNSPMLPVMAATLLLVAVYTFLSWASLQSTLVAHLLKGRRWRLVDHGQVDRSALRRAEMSLEELMAALREQSGVNDLARVRAAFLERDGQVSVVLKRKQG